MVFSAYQLTKEPRVLNGQIEEQRDKCYVQAVQPECVCVCVHVWKLRPGTSLAGELMKTSVLDPGQISTSVMLAVVTDSQTLRVLPPPSLSPIQKNK